MEREYGRPPLETEPALHNRQKELFSRPILHEGKTEVFLKFLLVSSFLNSATLNFGQGISLFLKKPHLSRNLREFTFMIKAYPFGEATWPAFQSTLKVLRSFGLRVSGAVAPSAPIIESVSPAKTCKSLKL